MSSQISHLTEPPEMGKPDPEAGQAQRLFEDLLLGSRPPAVAAIRSNLGVCPDYWEPEEMEEFLRAHKVDGLLAGLDLHHPGAEADATLATWPSVLLKDPIRLFRELRVATDPTTGRILAPAGTREFAQKYFRKNIWTGSDEDLLAHQEQVKTANFLMLLLTQRDLGLDDPRLLVQLRFFTATSALEVLAGYEANPDAWGAGQLHLDNDHLALLMRVPVPDGFCLVPVRLVIPAHDADPLPVVNMGVAPVLPDWSAPLILPHEDGPADVDPVGSPAEEPIPPLEPSSQVTGDKDDPFLPVQSGSMQDFRQKVDEVMNFYAPGFIARQADAKKMLPDSTQYNARPLQLWLSFQGLLRLIRHCGGVEWKFTDPDGTAYTIWLAEGEHTPDGDHVVASVCLSSPRRGKGETLTFKVS